MSTEQLLKLIAELNGWGNQFSRIRIGYMPARRYNEYGESDGLDYSDWGYVVETNLCRCDEKVEVAAQGKDLNEALLKLAKAIPEKLEELCRRNKSTAESARKALTTYLENNNEGNTSTNILR